MSLGQLALTYHGVQETISECVKAQRFLYDRSVSSVVFDYTGSGNSSRPGAIRSWRRIGGIGVQLSPF
jgi:hypothetical protein